MANRDSKVDELLKQRNWTKERRKLRSIIRSCGLTETVKWSKLCYTHHGSNVAIIFALKDYCAVGFFKGALLVDEMNVLVSPGQHSQAMRQIRFTSLREIVEHEDDLKSFLQQAIDVEDEGLKIAFKEKDQLVLPQEMQDRFDVDPDLKAAFEGLTPGRQRGYVLHVSGAKQAKTRVARIEKCAARIRQGKGFNDR